MSVAAGIIYGWQSLLDILKREGVFAADCPHAPAEWCPAADVKFNEIFTAGSFGALGGGLVFGIVLDHYGPRLCCVLGHIMLLLGLLLMAFSKTGTFEAFLPAYLLMGLAGSPVQLAVLHVCNEFEQASSAMSIFAGTYAASALVFVVFKVSAVLARDDNPSDDWSRYHTPPPPLQATDASYKTLFLVYCIVILVNLILGVLYLPPAYVWVVVAGSEAQGG